MTFTQVRLNCIDYTPNLRHAVTGLINKQLEINLRSCTYQLVHAGLETLTISVRQAAVVVQHTMTFQYGRPLNSGIRNVKFSNFFNTNFSAMWSHVLYIAFEGDDSAIQWCQFYVSLSGSLFDILQVFASFSQNPKFLQWRTVFTKLAICCVVLDLLFDNLTDKSY